MLPATERPGAELLAWSAVHGLAMLALEGPLRDLPPGAVDELAPRLVRMVDLGLGLGGGAPTGGPTAARPEPRAGRRSPKPGRRSRQAAPLGCSG